MRTIWVVAGLLLVFGLCFAQDDYDQVANLKFVVVKDYNGKPIRNAAVVLHPVNGKDKQERGGVELKTNADGKASYDGVPYGTLRIQALAQGFQTYGEDFDISKPTMAITIRLKRPVSQFSIYSDQNNDKKKPPAKDSGGQQH
jgi:Carboxypeptidase regulatory-like domain